MFLLNFTFIDYLSCFLISKFKLFQLFKITKNKIEGESEKLNSNFADLAIFLSVIALAIKMKLSRNVKLSITNLLMKLPIIS